MPYENLDTTPISMAVVMKEIRISAAHQLLFHPGKCARKHGHNYRIQVWAKGPVDSHTGMVIDFDDMKKHLDQVIGKFDHTDFNPVSTRFNYLTTFLGGVQSDPGSWIETTAENLAHAWLWDLQQISDRYCGVRVWETETCYAQAGHTE